MRMVFVGGCGVLLALAACGTDTASPGHPLTSYNNLVPPPGQVAVAVPGCVVQSHGGRIRAGDNMPTYYAVRNTGRWCFWGIGLSGVSPAGARLVGKPDHGEVRILPISNGIAVGYRPNPGFAGSDSFLVTMPSGFGGYDINVAATVEVSAPTP